MTDQPRKVRELTGRGYVRSVAQQWAPEAAPEDTAPPPADRTRVPSLEAWGVTRGEALGMVRSRMCPACGQGPWKSVLNHASRKHGIDRFTMRDICGLTTVESVVDDETREKFVRNGKNQAEEGRDFSALASRRSGRQRWTAAGAQKQIDTLKAWEESDPAAAHAARVAAARAAKTPEALAKRSETFRRKRSER